MANIDTSRRCDGCGAQAYVTLILTTGGELLFCGNHWDRHKHTLQDAGVYDDEPLKQMRRDIQSPKLSVDA
jgi:hypothetical protein